LGFWDRVKSVYKSVDRKVGGYLPGGVSPGSTSSSSSSSSGSTSTSSSSGGGSTSSSSGSTSSSSSSRSSGGGGSSSGRTSGGASYTSVDIPAQKKDAVIVTDFTSGESVKTTIDQKGNITSQTYRKPGGSSGGSYTSAVGTSAQQLQQEKAQLDKDVQSFKKSPGTSTQASALNKRIDSYNTKTQAFNNTLSIPGLVGRKGGLVSQVQKQKKATYQEPVINRALSSSGGSSGRNTASYGALIVTPAEAKTLKGSGIAYWESEAKNFDDALIEGQFASSVPYFASGGVKTRGIYEYNMQGIIAGKTAYSQYKNTITDFQANPSSYAGKPGVKKIETLEGTSYQLTPQYFSNQFNFKDTYKNSLTDAKTSFSNLPASTRRKLNIGSYGVGVTSTVIGVGEFAGTVVANFGVQTSKDGTFKTQKVEFGGTLGRIRTTPTTKTTVGFLESPLEYSKQKVRSPEFLGGATVIVGGAVQGVGSAVSNIKTYGWKTGSIETLSGFSPIRIKSGIYGQNINPKTKVNIASVKYTNQQGITSRVYSGRTGSINLYGVERSQLIKGTPTGSGYTTTQTPTLNIRGGGSIITQGTRTTISPYTFRGSGSGKVYYNAPVQNMINLKVPAVKGVKGGTSAIQSARGLTIYEEPGRILGYASTKAYGYRGGSASKGLIDGVNKFYSGRARSIPETTINNIRQPSGRYKLTPQARGIEIDLNKIISGYQSQGGKVTTGGGSTKLKRITKLDPGVQAVIQETPTQTFKSSTTFAPIALKTSSSQEFKNPQVSIKKVLPAQRDKQDLFSSNVNIVIPSQTQKVEKSSRSRSGLLTIPQTKDLITPKSAEDQAQIPGVRQVQKVRVRLVQRSGLRNINPPAITYNIEPPFPSTPSSYIPPPPFPIPAFPGGLKGFGIGNVRGRQTQAYTPSFTALFLGIKGKEPKGVKTGLRLRPITPNFSFMKIRKIRRVRL